MVSGRVSAAEYWQKRWEFAWGRLEEEGFRRLRLHAELDRAKAQRDATLAEVHRLRELIDQAIRIGDMSVLWGWTEEDRKRDEEFNADLPDGGDD